VESRSNVDALDILGEHDVLLDQLRVGWYGAVAVEAMARGKPVVAHLNAMDRALIAPAFAADIPIIEATPETVVDALGRLVMMPRTALRGLGLRSRAFAETWHDPRTVARTALAAYGLR
jgi:glycosyltransferase involved in cell wall biosynthesis